MAVCAVALTAGFVAVRIRGAVLGDGHAAGSSFLVIGLAATLAFWALCALGRRGWAWGITALLLIALAGGAFAAVASKRLDPDGVMPRISVELPQVPDGLVKVSNWLADQPPTWVLHEPAITFASDGSAVIDGTPPMDYASLAVSSPMHLAGGTHIVVEGVVSAGGAYVGLQQGGRWVDFNTLDRVGPFRKWVAVPRNGDYQLVVAYGVAAHARTHVELSSLTLWR
jgi:hypothetical protein